MGRNLEQRINLAHRLQSDFSDSFLCSALFFAFFFPISLFNLGEPQADHPNCSRHCDVTRDTDVISYIYYIRNGRLGLIQVI